MSKNISRRDFLKLTLTSLTAAFLAACGRALGIPATPSPTLAPTSTDTPAPTATNTLLFHQSEYNLSDFREPTTFSSHSPFQKSREP